MVKNEMVFLEDSDVVYKLVGPVLVKEDQELAKQTIDKRLEFINKEMYVYIFNFKELKWKINTKTKKL